MIKTLFSQCFIVHQMTLSLGEVYGIVCASAFSASISASVTLSACQTAFLFRCLVRLICSSCWIGVITSSSLPKFQAFVGCMSPSMFYRPLSAWQQSVSLCTKKKCNRIGSWASIIENGSCYDIKLQDTQAQLSYCGLIFLDFSLLCTKRPS